jgi:acetylornithine deacetylase/succinyl-diaminopimelate desuccinylase-like protein
VVRYRELFPEVKVELIGYGPGREEDAHTVNEAISLESLKECHAGYQGILLEILKQQ